MVGALKGGHSSSFWMNRAVAATLRYLPCTSVTYFSEVSDRPFGNFKVSTATGVTIKELEIDSKVVICGLAFDSKMVICGLAFDAQSLTFALGEAWHSCMRKNSTMASPSGKIREVVETRRSASCMRIRRVRLAGLFSPLLEFLRFCARIIRKRGRSCREVEWD